MKTSTSRASLVIAGTAAFIAACGTWGNRPPTLLRQASPNPFPGHRGYRVAPVSFDGALIGDVALSAQRRSELEGDLVAFQSRFAEAVIDRCGASLGASIEDGRVDPSAFVIRPALIRIGEIGSTSTDQASRLTVRIFGPDDSPLDVIVLYDANGGYAVGSRLRHAGTDFGRQLCAYLRRRSNSE